MRLASRGLRDMDRGPEIISVDEERTVVQNQARQVRRRARTVALLAGVVALLLP